MRGKIAERYNSNLDAFEPSARNGAYYTHNGRGRVLEKTVCR
jgi:hypothetical protein